ncbi:hypothetical protein [Modestobacter marinus]|uniref:hypothetical protein n=1 Tax=Modestobacter marinus TaxID=477641 RepID=UPI001C9582B1|nr:hypothetical protein [Modestobacter marinus]
MDGRLRGPQRIEHDGRGEPRRLVALRGPDVEHGDVVGPGVIALVDDSDRAALERRRGSRVEPQRLELVVELFVGRRSVPAA